MFSLILVKRKWNSGTRDRPRYESVHDSPLNLLPTNPTCLVSALTLCMAGHWPVPVCRASFSRRFFKNDSNQAVGRVVPASCSHPACVLFSNPIPCASLFHRQSVLDEAKASSETSRDSWRIAAALWNFGSKGFCDFASPHQKLQRNSRIVI